MSDHVELHGNTLHGPVQGSGVQHNHFGPVPGGGLPDLKDWPKGVGVFPVALGMHPTRQFPGEEPYALHVERPVDLDLRRLIADSADAAGLYLVTGEPLSGKTSTALIALIQEFPQHRVCVPPPGADLRSLPTLLRGRKGAYLLWLDDLENHLSEHGLSAGLLARLTELRVPVLATMRDAAYEKHRFGALTGGRVLRAARRVAVSNEWTPRQLAKARDQGDPRLDDAVSRRGDRSVTEYLATGPELWDEWLHADRPAGHPRGHLLVRAAVDLARCGITGPVSLGLLREVHERYGPEPGSESFEDALAWAVAVRHGVTGLLVPGETDGTYRAFGSLVADALRSPEVPPVPDTVWGIALVTADQDDAYDHAAVAAAARVDFLARAENGDTAAMYSLGLLDSDEQWLRKAADAGHTAAAGEVGKRLAARGDTREAEPYLESAARSGDADAALVLGKLLRERAKHWLGVSAQAGNPEAAHHLGDLYFGAGDHDAAFTYYDGAAEAGYAAVAASYGALHHASDEREAAEIWFRRAVEAGDKRAVYAMSRYGRQAIEVEEECYRDDAQKGRSLDATHLGVFLENRGARVEASAWYRRGFELGDAYGAFRLALLLAAEGKDAEARDWYRKAADMGHPGARKALGENPERPG
ncbi:tetratricopeptide repeat protein [Streptomyces sp. NPDC000410]|uniref:tetratricopeptide repeat protein n=1 Tax=Streptomyces sp. NPDC000410 TaxID=3154254 RepID=UPI00331E813A